MVLVNDNKPMNIDFPFYFSPKERPRLYLPVCLGVWHRSPHLSSPHFTWGQPGKSAHRDVAFSHGLQTPDT
ncbi:hypothetical protein RRG08_042545 [Elysia crispata]|uniref:Uncharacterized protein n=1 Tax=Elysia crispata TaxID=231223 RepID=A0AAE0XQ21_9GAST|nr:hypothetical protein RRG08_042545 [Elysia crispata]